jgi:hypothetical protein
MLPTKSSGEEPHHEQPERPAVFRIVCAADGLGIAEVGSVCVVLWRGEVVRDTFLRQRAALEEISARNRGHAGFIMVVEQGTTPPGEEMRKASIEMISALSDRLSCIACVIEGAGFRAAVTRSVLSGMRLLLPNLKTAVKFMASMTDAAAWVAPRCRGVTAATLCEAHEALQARLAT